MFFKDITGQEIAKSKLIAGVNQGRISHAQLFLGHPGWGSLSLALAYAKYVNCIGRGEDDSCGICNSCKMMEKLEHPDLHFSFPVIKKNPSKPALSSDWLAEWKLAVSEKPYIDYFEWIRCMTEENKQGNITADECREIIKGLALKPFYDGYKILLIWYPEYLGVQGNILLKTLEEPQENTLILLVAQSEEQLLPTILSRSQILKLKKLSRTEVREALLNRFEQSEENASAAAALADGDLNRGLSLAESTGEEDFTFLFKEWMRLCFNLSKSNPWRWVEEMATKGREKQKNFLLYSLYMFRETMLANAGLESLSIKQQTEEEFISKFPKYLGEEALNELTERFNKAYYYIERNANARIVFLNLSLHIVKHLKEGNRRLQLA